MEQSAKTKERFSETNESFTMLEAINEAKRLSNNQKLGSLYFIHKI